MRRFSIKYMMGEHINLDDLIPDIEDEIFNRTFTFDSFGNKIKPQDNIDLTAQKNIEIIIKGWRD